MKVHPVADLFPMLPEDELDDLAKDIKANGLQHSIVVKDGELIDGRNRLAACQLAGVEPSYEELDSQDPVAYILSANLARRHMSKGQRAMAAAKTVDLINTGTREGARIAGTDPAYVSRAGQVLDADAALADQVLAGIIPLPEAHSTIQQRRNDTERLAAQREQLRSIAPDLDDQVSEEVIQLTEALAEAQLRDQERNDAIRRGTERLLSLIDGWVELQALSSNPLRNALLEGLNKQDRQTVQEIEAMYEKVGT